MYHANRRSVLSTPRGTEAANAFSAFFSRLAFLFVSFASSSAVSSGHSEWYIPAYSSIAGGWPMANRSFTPPRARTHGAESLRPPGTAHIALTGTSSAYACAGFADTIHACAETSDSLNACFFRDASAAARARKSSRYSEMTSPGTSPKGFTHDPFTFSEGVFADTTSVASVRDASSSSVVSVNRSFSALKNEPRGLLAPTNLSRIAAAHVSGARAVAATSMMVNVTPWSLRSFSSAARSAPIPSRSSARGSVEEK
mmetsp:Transcript_13861/g.59334  ORF Transcript_13861/g.59334 Transcript_13861/m.59334 type:complete len:256 (+) Transcript_13861:4466-5233(+)